MSNRMEADKRERVLMGMYGSSQGISTLALIIVAAFEIMMLGYTIINVELYGPYLLKYRLFYVSLLAVAVIYIILNEFVKKDIEHRYVLLGAANLFCAIFFFAWALSITYSDSLVTGIADPAVFMTFSMVVPLSFTMLPSIYAVIVILADGLMLYLIISVTGIAASLINVVIFFVFQFVLGISFLRLKMNLSERIVQEEENARIDVMTDLPNRRIYEEDLNRLKKETLPDDLHYVVIDINGLKNVNDSFGHETGDRLIIGAARCIEKCFKNWGRQYRIGGDEFVLLLSAGRDKVNELISEFRKVTEEWTKDNGITLTTSLGAVGSCEYPEYGIIELARVADERMYEEKERYYKSIGLERRRYQAKTMDNEKSE